MKLADCLVFSHMFLLPRILEAYRTGRGRIIVRGKTEIEVLDSKTKRTAIIIKEVSSLSFTVVLLWDVYFSF